MSSTRTSLTIVHRATEDSNHIWESESVGCAVYGDEPLKSRFGLSRKKVDFY